MTDAHRNNFAVAHGHADLGRVRHRGCRGERQAEWRHRRDATALQLARPSRARSATRRPDLCPRRSTSCRAPATRTCRRTPPSSTGRSSARPTATRATPTRTGSATSSTAAASPTPSTSNDDIGPLNSGAHTTLFHALEAHIGGVFPVPIVNDDGEMVGWAYFKLLVRRGRQREGHPRLLRLTRQCRSARRLADRRQRKPADRRLRPPPGRLTRGGSQHIAHHARWV